MSQPLPGQSAPHDTVDQRVYQPWFERTRRHKGAKPYVSSARSLNSDVGCKLTAIARFWRWFAENASRYRRLDVPEKEDLLNELQAALQAYNADLWFEVGGAPEGPRELVISAEGKRSAFGAVRALVAAAPLIPGWKAVAFKPRQGFEFVTSYEDITVAPDAAWFMPVESKNEWEGIDICVAYSHFEEKRRRQFEAATYVMLEAGLGEIAAAELINVIEVRAAPENPEIAGYLLLEALPRYLAENGYEIGI